jgi:hypothetical protein
MGVTIQMKEIVAPFMIGIHYFVYRKFLAMLVLSNFCLVVELGVLLQAMYVFFLIHLKSSWNSRSYVICPQKKGTSCLRM